MFRGQEPPRFLSRSTGMTTYTMRQGNYRGFTRYTVNHVQRWLWWVIDIRTRAVVASGNAYGQEDARVTMQRALLFVSRR